MKIKYIIIALVIIFVVALIMSQKPKEIKSGKSVNTSPKTNDKKESLLKSYIGFTPKALELKSKLTKITADATKDLR